MIDISKLVLADVMPEATARRIIVLVEEFQRGKLSGHVDVRLNFRLGDAMPSDVGFHERQVKAKP